MYYVEEVVAVELNRPSTNSNLRIWLPRPMTIQQTINYIDYKYPAWTITFMETGE